MAEEPRTSALRYIGAVGRLCFHSLAYCLHPLTDDYTYVVKARAWCDLKAYSQAIRCLQKALRESEMAFVRAEMAWCYGELGMTEQALTHYRIAYDRNKHPKIAIGLAWTEFHLDHREESRALVEAIRQPPKPLDAEDIAWLQDLEERLALGSAAPRL
jgi:tetratricopeptide (TPR) repeat protein